MFHVGLTRCQYVNPLLLYNTRSRMTTDTILPDVGMLQQSVVVAAHPDDEVLWFSSTLAHVDQIILCFSGVGYRPDWTAGRRESLAEYPLDHMVCLDLDESEAFRGVDWSNPVITDYGLLISRRAVSGLTYKRNFERLRNKLRSLLAGCRNVVTHNPWGEYGHVEHVQVYRAIKSLQDELAFEIWYPNYCSNKSLVLMQLSMPRLGNVTQTLPTNKTLAQSIADIYKKNNCWTWYDDHEWCEEETFIRDVDDDSAMPRNGRIYPVSLIRVDVEETRPAQPGRLTTVRTRLTNAVKRLRN